MSCMADLLGSEQKRTKQIENSRNEYLLDYNGLCFQGIGMCAFEYVPWTIWNMPR